MRGGGPGGEGELSEMAKRAVSKGGSSFMDLDGLMKDLKM